MGKKLSGDFANENINPCIHESNLSMQCLQDKLYVYSECELFFENYRNCKKFWGKVAFKRKKAGISPAMPTKEERDRIIQLKEQGINVISSDE